MNILMAVITAVGAGFICVGVGSYLLQRWTDERVQEALKAYMEREVK